MFELCLHASHGYPPCLDLNRELGMSMSSKDFHSFSPTSALRQDITRSGSLSHQPLRNKAMCNQVIDWSESIQFAKLNSAIQCPFAGQDECNGSLLFSFGISEQCINREKSSQLRVSSQLEERIDGLDLSSLPDLTGSQDFLINTFQDSFASSLFYPSIDFYTQMPLVDFVGDLARSSKITVQTDGQVSFTGTGAEMKDLLSMAAEFYASKSLPKCKTRPILVPHYTRLDTNEVGGSVQLHSLTVAPLKSPEKVKPKPSHKRKNMKKFHERDLYEKNYFHACESLLSLIANKGRNGKTTILSLKKSAPELLTQFSVGIAGTGLAVLFSVICQVGCGAAPFCSSKLFNTGFALGLVWLSLAVNKLRDTIVYISKNAGKFDSRDEEMMKRVNKSRNEIYFRSATLMAMMVLRIA